MSCGVSHRCLTIVMRRMFCQRSTLRVGNSCYIAAVITCRWMPLCSVALSPHVLSLANNPTMVFEKIQKKPIPPNYHLSCHSRVRMTHSKSSSNLSPSCSFTHSASDHPCTPPPVVPTGRFQGPRPSLLAASTAAPAARSCSTTAVWPN